MQRFIFCGVIYFHAMNIDTIEAGLVLHASKELDETYFENAVILIIITNSDGAFGLILNRGTHMPVAEVFDPAPRTAIKSRLFYLGGPVDEEALHMLRLVPDTGGDGYPFVSGVELGGEWHSIESIVESSEVTNRLFLGYSGWGSGQLEDEISEGSWIVHKGINVQELLAAWLEPPLYSHDEIEEYLIQKRAEV